MGSLTSIIIVNRDGGHLLLDCVGSVRKFSKNCELIVVDNGSTDGSPEKLQAWYSDVRLIRNPFNYGFARANNVGMKEAKGKYVVLLNSDTVVTCAWLDRLVECVEKDQRIGLATPKLLRPDGRLDSTGHIFMFKEADARNRGEEEPDNGQYDGLTDLVSCDFACVLIKRKVWEEIGFLDQKFFFFHEDMDFCIRAGIAGWRIVYCPSSIVYHVRGGSTSPRLRRKFVDQRRRYLLRLVLKNYETKNIVVVFLYLGGEIVISILGVLRGLKNHDLSYLKLRLRNVGTILVAMLWNVAHPPLKERIVVQARRKVSDSQLMARAALT